MALPQKQEITEKTIVEALAEDVAVHGWKVTSYTVSQDVEKEERSLSIKLHRSTGTGQQEEMDLAKGKRKGRGGVHVVEDGEGGAAE